MFGQVLDIYTEAGREGLLDLLSVADILVTNLKIDALAKADLTYPALKGRFPALIVGHLHANGHTGPAMNDLGKLNTVELLEI